MSTTSSTACCAVLERPGQCQGEIFNLGNPANDITIAELARQIRAAYAALVPGVTSASRTVSAEAFYGTGYDDSVERIPESTKAEERLGFFPRTPIAEMLPPIVRDYLLRYQHRVDAREMTADRNGRRRGAPLRSVNPGLASSAARHQVTLAVVIPAYQAGRHLDGVVGRCCARRCPGSRTSSSSMTAAGTTPPRSRLAWCRDIRGSRWCAAHATAATARR